MFVKNYPKSSKLEESAYLSAHSHFLASPVYSLDQKDTQEAITALQNFLYKYPESDKVMRGGMLLGCHHGITSEMMSHMHESIDLFLKENA